MLTAAKLNFREAKRAEKITGFDQTPDFIVPDEFNPAALIDAKLTEDEGTARDKVTRVQSTQRGHAASISGDGWQSVHADNHPPGH